MQQFVFALFCRLFVVSSGNATADDQLTEHLDLRDAIGIGQAAGQVGALAAGHQRRGVGDGAALAAGAVGHHGEEAVLAIGRDAIAVRIAVGAVADVVGGLDVVDLAQVVADLVRLAPAQRFQRPVLVVGVARAAGTAGGHGVGDVLCRGGTGQAAQSQQPRGGRTGQAREKSHADL